jgi:hypothetical protein
MMDFAGIMGLWFAVILFNMTYPQAAIELLKEATEDFFKLKDVERKENEKYLDCLRGWFFYTDLLHFLLTYFTGIFSIIFFLLFFIPAKGSITNFTTCIIAIIAIFFYVWVLLKSLSRMSTYNEENGWMNRRNWLYRLGPARAFKSKIPIISVIILGFIGTLVFICLLLFRFVHLGLSFVELRIMALGLAAMIIVVTYLFVVWGLSLYWPFSSAALLRKAAVLSNHP